MTNFLRPSVKILYEDEDLLGLNKPVGLLSHPNPRSKKEKEDRALFRAPYDFKIEAFVPPDESPIYLLHRLDRDTSGVILCAKNEKTARIIKDHFENRKVRKVYTALLYGSVHPRQGEWRDHLDKGGLAETSYKVSRTFPEAPATLVELYPKTGKTHQLRIQSARHHYPILGDRVDGHFQRNKEFAKHFGLKRMFLHASQIEFFHPGLQNKILLTSELPSDLSRTLELLQ